ncbi:hypothetical protein [Rhodoblastus sp.]|jgi:hypothetical protein|uniref:hypothetical protein n=1 Tax=Rhodoblastus sp. TaxID=1962975 RepID=UPI0025F59A15|nr:hypothetical protein [Rhodoblastus sp.]
MNTQTKLLLRDAPVWAYWQATQRDDGSWNKGAPRDPITRRWASYTRAEPWQPYAVAAAAVGQPSPTQGLALILGQKSFPIFGVDLDSCRDTDTGELTPWAQDIVDRLDSYTEISPSQTGLKIYCLIKKQDVEDLERVSGGECHNRTFTKVQSKGRHPLAIELKFEGWFAFTGQSIKGDAIAPLRPEDLEWLLRVAGPNLSGQPYVPPTPPQPQGSAPTYAEVASAVMAINNRGEGVDRYTWLKVCAGLKRAGVEADNLKHGNVCPDREEQDSGDVSADAFDLAEAYRDLFYRWSALCTRNDPRYTVKTYSGFRLRTSGKTYTLATIFHIANEHYGWSSKNLDVATAPRPEDAAKVDLVRPLWHNAQPIADTDGERWLLQHAKLDALPSAALTRLRFTPDRPTVWAALHRVTDGFCGVWSVSLDGSITTHGPAHGGGIWLTDACEGDVLVVTDKLVTGLQRAGHGPVVVAVNGIETLLIGTGFHKVKLLVGEDKRRAASVACHQWARAGVDVEVYLR